MKVSKTMLLVLAVILIGCPGTSSKSSRIPWVVIGTDGTILTSPDGETWTKETSGLRNALNGVAHSGSFWVAVGDKGTILTSLNGKEWTKETSGVTHDLTAVAHAGSLWVAVGYRGTILTSEDGKSWSQVPENKLPDKCVDTLSGVAHSGSLWVATGDWRDVKNPGNTTGIPVSLISKDGKDWREKGNFLTPGKTGDLGSVAHADSLWVAVGGYNVGHASMQTSDDGESWSLFPKETLPEGFGRTPINDVAHDGARWVVVGQNGILTSADGRNWRTANLPKDFSGFVSAIAHGGSLWVAIGGTANILTSKDGTTWSQVSEEKIPGVGTFNFNDIAHAR